MKKRRIKINKVIFFILLVLILVLGTLNFAKAKGLLIPEEKELVIKNNTINLADLTLKQKIAQMIVVHGSSSNLEAWKKMQLGGIHLFAMEKKGTFQKTIKNYQENYLIPFFVTIDLEGCLNAFANFKNFTYANKINTIGRAFEKGTEEGKYLKELGFNLNFAPVVDLDDQIWRCRSFPGNESKITELAEAYVLGLQNQGIIGTIKHYPGKTLVVKDPHKHLVLASIDDRDVYPYSYFFEKNEVKAVMVSHLITSGAVDSSGVPAVVSEKVVKDIKKEFDGLIISDEINMLGLKKYYSSLDELYVAVFNAGNDLILNFNDDPNEVYNMIKVVEKAVKVGKIQEKQIDNSVKKILKLKGFKVLEN